MDYSPEGVIAGLGAAVTALVSGGLWFRKKMRDDGVDGAGSDSVKRSVEVNDKVLANMQAELTRLAKRVDVLEEQVTHLTQKLANVRLIALDCYQLASDCACEGENRARLLEHLKQIIRDA
jgi:uncharacterized coiled-coil protein SlyX